MEIGQRIYRLRNAAKITQEQFAKQLGVSRQSVQKWESGASVPELEKLICIAKRFGVSMDELLLGTDRRGTDALQPSPVLKPQYASMETYEFYASDLQTEYTQSIEEGLDLERYKDLFAAVAQMPNSESKKKIADVLFEIVSAAPLAEDYPYTEPSDLEGIRALRDGYRPTAPVPDRAALGRKIHGAWMGRVCGCLLGRTVEAIHSDELIPFLKESGNYPMHRYIRSTDVTEETEKKYRFRFASSPFADTCDGMPVDDDTNYTVMAQYIIDRYGRDFTPDDVARTWMEKQSRNAYFTAERVAYCNFIKGYAPPASAQYKNPFREWIGAQIRGDYFGYINPGDPETAAEMAFRDACISHTKNGIYGEMFAAAMIAAAAVTDDVVEILRCGLGQIPCTSRLYRSVTDVIESFKNGVSSKDALARVHAQYDEYTSHGWCHTISNAMVVAIALLYGGGDYGRSVCMAVESCYDTDCNGATVGSVLGMAHGIDSIGDEWTAPIGDTLHTSIFGIGTVRVSDCAQQTLRHLP